MWKKRNLRFLGQNVAGLKQHYENDTNLIKPTVVYWIFGEKLTDTSYEVLKKNGDNYWNNPSFMIN